MKLYSRLYLTPKVMQYLIHAYREGTIRKKTCPIKGMTFYTMTWHLRDLGLIKDNGLYSDSNEKVWILTEKGKHVAELVVKLWRTLYGEEE